MLPEVMLLEGCAMKTGSVSVPLVSLNLRQLLPSNQYKALTVVLYTMSPLDGTTTEFIWLVVIRGGKNPLVVDLTSSMAELSGLLLSLLIPTWACITNEQVMQQTSAVSFFMIANFRVCK